MFIVDFEKEGIAVAGGEEEQIYRDQKCNGKSDLPAAWGQGGIDALGYPGDGRVERWNHRDDPGHEGHGGDLVTVN